MAPAFSERKRSGEECSKNKKADYKAFCNFRRPLLLHSGFCLGYSFIGNNTKQISRDIVYPSTSLDIPDFICIDTTIHQLPCLFRKNAYCFDYRSFSLLHKSGLESFTDSTFW